MSVCVASAPVPSSSWAPHPRPSGSRPGLRRTSATWNSKFPAGLDLDLSLPAAASVPAPLFFVAPVPQPKPRLRLPSLPPAPPTPTCRFNPFADDDEPPRAARPTPQENLPPRGRTLTPLTISSPLPAPSPSPAPAPAPTGRRRSPSFSAGSPSLSPSGARVALPLSALSSLSTLLTLPSPAPSLSRAAPPPAAPPVPGAPSPFLARHYPTPDARARLLARTLLHRIHAVGRPRTPYACAASSSGPRAKAKNGYESECGAREYVPSRLSECVVAC